MSVIESGVRACVCAGSCNLLQIETFVKPHLNPLFWALVIPTAAKTLKCLLQSEPGFRNRNKTPQFPPHVKGGVAETLRAEANVTLLQTETGPQGIFESFVLKSPSLHIQPTVFSQSVAVAGRCCNA